MLKGHQGADQPRTHMLRLPVISNASNGALSGRECVPSGNILTILAILFGKGSVPAESALNRLICFDGIPYSLGQMLSVWRVEGRNLP